MSAMGGQQYPYDRRGDYGQPRGGVPVWAWVLIGCGVFGLFFVAILAAILFPVFAQARNRARAASCLSNEKQMALGVLMYSQDYDQMLPQAQTWTDGIDPYIKNQQMYHCPSVSSSVYGYAFNRNASQRRVDRLASPYMDVILFDSTILSRNASDALQSLPAPPRHTAGNNAAYADGHVRTATPQGPPLTAEMQ